MSELLLLILYPAEFKCNMFLTFSTVSQSDRLKSIRCSVLNKLAEPLVEVFNFAETLSDALFELFLAEFSQLRYLPIISFIFSDTLYFSSLSFLISLK